MMMSIAHRISGVALYFGSILIVWWFASAAHSDSYFDLVQSFFGHWFGRLLMFGFTWAMFHHAIGGIRHFIWDLGKGFNLITVENMARINLVGGFPAHHPALGHRLWSDVMNNEGNMRTPLKKVRGFGASKTGTDHFWQQRATAVANIPLMICMIWFVLAHLGATRAEVIASLHNPFIALVLIMGLASVFWHMRVGLAGRD